MPRCATSTLTANAMSMPETTLQDVSGYNSGASSRVSCTGFEQVASVTRLLTAAVAPALVCYQKLQKQVQMQP